jgi:hypothetical protein
MASDAVVLGAAQYGKAEVRLLHVDRGQPEHRITDTVYAFARQHGVAGPEEFGLQLARHFAFYGADRPYGLIEGTLCRAGAPAGDPEHQW